MLLEPTLKRRRAISLTPLIDVVFILLLFFMLSSSFMQWRQIDLSSAAASETRQTATVRTIRIMDNGGALRLDDVALTARDASALAAQVGQAPDAVYAIVADQGVATQTLITLLDQLKQAGARHVALTGVLP